MKRAIPITLLLSGFAALISVIGWATSTQTAPWRPAAKSGDALRVLVVTGGHDHDADFYSLFNDDGIKALVDPHPGALSGDIRKRVDVLVLYDMLKEMEPNRQKNLRDFVEGDKGVVVLHHAIGDHINWPWWCEEVVGGRYLFQPADGKPASSYKHDEDIAVRPVGRHPITNGIRPFRIWDETYKGLWISPKVRVLLETDNPTSDGPVAWISPYEKSRVVYIQLGHDRNAHLNPNYQKLIKNAILWAAGKLR